MGDGLQGGAQELAGLYAQGFDVSRGDAAPLREIGSAATAQAELLHDVGRLQ
jgi:hypothetical protein